MKTVLASILALLLVCASFGGGAHAAGFEPSHDVHATAEDPVQGISSDCCQTAGHEMSDSCFMLIGLAPAASVASSPLLVERYLQPAASSPVASAGSGTLGKPPRTL